MPVGADQLVVEPGAEHVAVLAVPPVEIDGEALVHRLHARAQVRLRRPDEQVHVIRHLAVRQDLPPAPLDLVGQEPQIPDTVLVVDEQNAPVGRLRRHVVDPAGDFDSWETWHRPIYAHDLLLGPPPATKGPVPPQTLRYPGACPRSCELQERGLSPF
jgi:hypothetical protein